MESYVIDRLLPLESFSEEEKVAIVRYSNFITKVYMFGFLDSEKN